MKEIKKEDLNILLKKTSTSIKPEAVITITKTGSKQSSAVWYNSKYEKDFFYEEHPKYGWQFKIKNKHNGKEYNSFWKELEGKRGKSDR